MPQLIWTPGALRDLARLHRFLSRRNPDAARRAVGAIRRAVRLLAEHPNAGRPRAEGDLRELVIPFGSWGYLALYRVADPHVVLLAVTHGREIDYDET